MTSLTTRLSSHIAQMAPYQKKRKAGKLLIDSRERIKELEDLAMESYKALKNGSHAALRNKISETLGLQVFIYEPESKP